jgi:hypothetical protein
MATCTIEIKEPYKQLAVKVVQNDGSNWRRSLMPGDFAGADWIDSEFSLSGHVRAVADEQWTQDVLDAWGLLGF